MPFSGAAARSSGGPEREWLRVKFSAGGGAEFFAGSAAEKESYFAAFSQQFC
jgi:hypothetical protein